MMNNKNNIVRSGFEAFIHSEYRLWFGEEGVLWLLWGVLMLLCTSNMSVQIEMYQAVILSFKN